MNNYCCACGAYLKAPPQPFTIFKLPASLSLCTILFYPPQSRHSHHHRHSSLSLAPRTTPIQNPPPTAVTTIIHYSFFIIHSHSSPPTPPSPPTPHYPSPRTSLGSLAKGSWLAARLACFKYYYYSRHTQRPNLANLICRQD